MSGNELSVPWNKFLGFVSNYLCSSQGARELNKVAEKEQGGQGSAEYDFHRVEMRSDGSDITDNLFGIKGEHNHGHAAVNSQGHVVFLRDADGTVLHDDKKP